MLFHKLLAAGALLAASVQADVTLRYKTEVKLNPSLPPQMTEQMTKAMGTGMPPESVMQMKDGKGASAFGKFRSISDFAKGQILLVDPEQKRMGTIAADQLGDELGKLIAEMPPEARAAMAAMKSTAETKVTGRTSTIEGIAAEEREVTVTVEGPASAGMPAGPMIKMTMQFWTAKAEEMSRVPALKELAAQNIWGHPTMNPASSIEKILKQMPGMGDGIGKVQKDMQAARTMLLRTEMKMWMPAMAAMMKQLPPDKNPFGTSFDADAPFMEMTQSLSELSTATVPASVFAAPEGYRTVPGSELVQEMLRAKSAVK